LKICVIVSKVKRADGRRQGRVSIVYVYYMQFV